MDKYFKYVQYIPMLIDLGMKAVKRNADANNMSVEQALNAAQKNYETAATEDRQLRQEGHDDRQK